MGLRAKLARFLLFFPLLGLPLAAQPAIPLAPCRAAEPAPDLNKESNPTTRDAVVMHSDGGADSRMVTAEACLVLGTKQQILPGSDDRKRWIVGMQRLGQVGKRNTQRADVITIIK